MWVIWDGDGQFVSGAAPDRIGTVTSHETARKFALPADAYIFALAASLGVNWTPIKIENIPARAA